MAQEHDKRPVTRERIAHSALSVIDEEGTNAVTMRRIAVDLNIKAPSLYAHVKGREEILRLAHEQVIAEIGPLEVTGDWRQDLRDYYQRMHSILLNHGDVASLQFGSIPTEASSLQALESLIDLLTAAGFPPALAARAAERLSLYVTADAYEQWMFKHQKSAMPTLEDLSRQAPALVALVVDGPHAREPREAFEFGLDLILEGLAQQV